MTREHLLFGLHQRSRFSATSAPAVVCCAVAMGPMPGMFAGFVMPGFAALNAMQQAWAASIYQGVYAAAWQAVAEHNRAARHLAQLASQN
jgi:hypothetical protein